MKSDLNSGTAALPVVSGQASDDDDDLKDIGFVCQYFGGIDTPLHPSTAYRIIPEPEDMGGRMSRWRMSKLRRARQRLFDRAEEVA